MKKPLGKKSTFFNVRVYNLLNKLRLMKVFVRPPKILSLTIYTLSFSNWVTYIDFMLFLREKKFEFSDLNLKYLSNILTL